MASDPAVPATGAPPRRPPIRDPRLKLIALAALAFGFSALSEPAALAAMAALTLGVALASGIAPGALLRRLRLPGLLALALVAVLPLVSGETVVAFVGPLSIHAEGLRAAGLILIRFLCILTVAAAILSTLAPLQAIAALRALGAPWILTDLALLVTRYLAELRRDLARIRTAMTLRGHRPGPAGLGATGWALASLLLRSHDRAERIWMAMRLRGYGAQEAPSDLPRPDAAEIVALAALLALVAALLILQAAS